MTLDEATYTVVPLGGEVPDEPGPDTPDPPAAWAEYEANLSVFTGRPETD